MLVLLDLVLKLARKLARKLNSAEGEARLDMAGQTAGAVPAPLRGGVDGEHGQLAVGEAVLASPGSQALGQVAEMTPAGTNAPVHSPVTGIGRQAGVETHRRPAPAGLADPLPECRGIIGTGAHSHLLPLGTAIADSFTRGPALPNPCTP
jgi:hypothetical protein